MKVFCRYNIMKSPSIVWVYNWGILLLGHGPVFTFKFLYESDGLYIFADSAIIYPDDTKITEEVK